MADPSVGCGKTELHPFEGLVRSIMDGSLYYVHCKPPLQTMYGSCPSCPWHTVGLMIPRDCPQGGYPTRVLVRDKTP